MSEKEIVTNIFGDEIEACCYDPMTGYFRDGFCNTDEHDYGSHVVCAVTVSYTHLTLPTTSFV